MSQQLKVKFLLPKDTIRPLQSSSLPSVSRCGIRFCEAVPTPRGEVPRVIRTSPPQRVGTAPWRVGGYMNGLQGVVSARWECDGSNFFVIGGMTGVMAVWPQPQPSSLLAGPRPSGAQPVAQPGPTTGATRVTNAATVWPQPQPSSSLAGPRPLGAQPGPRPGVTGAATGAQPAVGSATKPRSATGVELVRAVLLTPRAGGPACGWSIARCFASNVSHVIPP